MNLRKPRIVELAALAVTAALTMGAGCPLVPQIQDRVVELAMGGSTSTVFEAVGSINTFSEQETIDFASTLDLGQIIDDAGIDPSDVMDVALAGVSYRVVRKDPTDTRAIENGNVQIGRGTGAPGTPLITSFTETVNTVTSFKTAPLDPAGVALLNQLLDDMLDNIKNGTPVTNPQIVYQLNGDSTPSGVDTDFSWEIKVDISVVGKIKVKVIG
jgi:hypothetical protein